MQMYRKSENPYFSYIFFEHGYLIYYSTYLFEILYVYCIAEISMEGSMSSIHISAIATIFDLGLFITYHSKP